MLGCSSHVERIQNLDESIKNATHEETNMALSTLTELLVSLCPSYLLLSV